MSSADPTADAFLVWAASHGCILAPDTCKLTHFDGMGRGLVATRDIGEDELLFEVPRRILLNLRTSRLGAWCEASESAQMQEEEGSAGWAKVRQAGWAPLILAMMWEKWRVSDEGRQAWAQVTGDGAHLCKPEGEDTGVQWSPYFDIMPTSFDSPMMWEADELKELEGTDVLPRVGRIEADESYTSVVRPYISSQPSIFLGLSKDAATAEAINAGIEKHYSLEHFHIMGSRVLSRSFHVKDGSQSRSEEKDGENEDEGEDEEEEEEDEEEDTADISMVPMADMLNARFNSDNARLFFKPDVLEMRSTAPISRGEQIFNTFGDPPNGDLLRRYGHVDEPNGADAVDLEATMLGEAVCELWEERRDSGKGEGSSISREAMKERVQWLCDSEDALLDDAFPITYLPAFPPTFSSTAGQSSNTITTIPPDTPRAELVAALNEALEEVGTLPEELLQCARTLTLPEADFEKNVRGKGKLPGPKLSAVADGVRVADVVVRALQIRLKAYPTTAEEDQAILAELSQPLGGAPESELDLTAQQRQRRRRAAVVVRLGEKRVLQDHILAFEAVAEAGREKDRAKEGTDDGAATKRKDRSAETGPKKRVKQ
ncbi:Ribosomal lysine N-methyltransferase 4 [Tilletia horrida]|nr:Ribosomal lysine N-methyltransferase 4 [Tilletia horrida]